MNNNRRKQIDEAITKVSQVRNLIESIRDDEQEYLDNMPENLQMGEKADISQTAIDVLENAIDDLELIESNLEEARN